MESWGPTNVRSSGESEGTEVKSGGRNRLIKWGKRGKGDKRCVEGKTKEI